MSDDSPAAPSSQEIAREARLIARAARSGALATSRRAKRATGQPYVSKVGLALDMSGAPLFLFSTLAAHTQDLLAEPRAAVLVEAPATTANPLEAPRATLVGRARQITDAAEAARARAMYLAHHPDAARYVDFGDFAFWTLDVERVHFVGGFGRAKWTKGAAYGLDAPELAAKRQALLESVNAHKAGQLARLAGARRGWRAVDLDPDGLTLAGPRATLVRVDFPSPGLTRRAWTARLGARVRQTGP